MNRGALKTLSVCNVSAWWVFFSTVLFKCQAVFSSLIYSLKLWSCGKARAEPDSSEQLCVFWICSSLMVLKRQLDWWLRPRRWSRAAGTYFRWLIADVWALPLRWSRCHPNSGERRLSGCDTLDTADMRNRPGSPRGAVVGRGWLNETCWWPGVLLVDAAVYSTLDKQFIGFLYALSHLSSFSIISLSSLLTWYSLVSFLSCPSPLYFFAHQLSLITWNLFCCLAQRESKFLHKHFSQS